MPWEIGAKPRKKRSHHSRLPWDKSPREAKGLLIVAQRGSRRRLRHPPLPFRNLSREQGSLCDSRGEFGEFLPLD